MPASPTPKPGLPFAIEFPVRRTEEPDAFDVILFADPQPASEAELVYVRDTAVTGVLGTRAALGTSHGIV